MIDEVYQQPFLNKLSNTLKFFEKQFYQNSTNYQTTWSYSRSSSIKIQQTIKQLEVIPEAVLSELSTEWLMKFRRAG